MTTETQIAANRVTRDSRRSLLGHMLNQAIAMKAIGIMTPKITAPTTSKRSPMIPALATPNGLAASWAALDGLCSATGKMRLAMLCQLID